MLFSIGQVVKMYNISHDTLRYYDKIDLLKPSIKKDNGYRYYSIREIEILEMILMAKQLEMPIKEIKDIIDKEDIDNYINLFNRHEQFLENKINYLMKLKKQARRSKNIAIEMKDFTNKNIKESLNIEDINKKVVYFNQNGDSYIGLLSKDRDLITVVKKQENLLVTDTNTIGVEIFEGDDYNLENHTGYVEKNYKGKYITINRKLNSTELNEFINELVKEESIKKYNKNYEDIFIEIKFTFSRKNKDNRYFIKIYIPINN